MSTNAIVCTETSILGASNIHLQVQAIESATREYNVVIAVVDNLIEGEHTVAYHLLAVHKEPISYVAMDVAYHIVWSGHKNGKVRSWPMQVVTEKPMTTTIPSLMWGAHQSPVTAIVIYSYGRMEEAFCT